jgi:hypothetical protein
LSSGPSGYDLSLISKHSNPYFVDAMVALMKSLANPTILLGSDVTLDHVVSHNVEPTVVLMQSLADTTPILGSDVSLAHVVSHPIQPTVEEDVVSMEYLVDPTLLLDSEKFNEVTLLMQSSVNPTLLLGGDASLDHMHRISSYVPSKQGSIPLSLSMLHPSPRMVSFDWDDLVETCLPSSAPF